MSYVSLGNLKVEDGTLIWKKDLKGWGFGYVIFSNTNTEEAMVTANQAVVVAATD